MNGRASVSKCKVRGASQWRVRWRESDKIKRKFFGGREAAEAFASERRGEAVGVRQLLAAIPQADQEKLVMLYNEATRRGVDLLTLLHSTPPPAAGPGVTLSKVVLELDEVKRKAGRDDGYLKSLGVVLGAFIKGREEMRVDQVGHVEIEKFLDSKNLAYRPTLRARLSTMFKFAVRRGYRLDNPCARLEPTESVTSPRSFLTPDQTKKLLKWFCEHPRCMAWFVLSTFAGLRPEEALKTSWSEIHFKEGWIKVEAQTTKVRQRRVVYPNKMAFAWLQKAKKLTSKLPLHKQTLKRDRKEFRKVVGFNVWPKDVTRHSAASYWLAQCGSAATVATGLGHSESVLRKNYMAIVTKVEAEKFWALRPAKK